MRTPVIEAAAWADWRSRPAGGAIPLLCTLLVLNGIARALTAPARDALGPQRSRSS